MGQYPTLQEGLKLFDYKVWQCVAHVALNLLLKCQPIFLHEFIESGLLGTVTFIGRCGFNGLQGHGKDVCPCNRIADLIASEWNWRSKRDGY